MKKKVVFVIFFLVAASMFFSLRHTRMDIAALLELPPCFRIGGALHHYFEPNCVGTSPVRKIEYSINEDGLRDRKRAEIGDRPILFLGDSMVEGWGIPIEDSIGRRVEEYFKVSGKNKSLNAGIRFTGPIVQSARLLKIVPVYKPGAIVWVLDENDVNDDKLFYSLSKRSDENGIPIEFSTDDFDSVTWLANWKGQLGFLSPLVDFPLYLLYQMNVKTIGKRWPKTNFSVCGGVQRGIEFLRKNHVPLFMVSLPLGPNNKNKFMVDEFKALFDCVKNEKVLDLRGVLRGRQSIYLARDTHLNAEGNKIVADSIMAAFGEDLRAVTGPVGKGSAKKAKHKNAP